ncbi:MAG TPA: lipid II flippase MurJ [Streptosporangiaceae bacterium]
MPRQDQTLNPAVPADPELGQPGISGIARGAAIIAGLTLLSRMLGLVRTLVFSQSVGATCLGTAYVTANQVPNLISELVLGGVLTGAMVPVLARSAERAGTDPAAKARVSQITSALLTWSVIILVPLTVAVAATAFPIAAVLNPANGNAHCVHADVVATTGNMLGVFAPQVLLYGVSVVLFGLLQAYRRFVGPSLAPVICSLVLIASYVAFVPLNDGMPLARLSLPAELVLAVGSTLAIGSLVVVALPPTWRLHLRLRPAVRFPPGVARRASGLALVGVIEFIANDVQTVVAIALANGHGSTGAIVLFNYAWQVFTSVGAVLALSIVISAFPVLSARDGPAFEQTCAGSTRAVLLVSWLGTAVIAAIALPVADVLATQPDQVSQLVQGFALFAPGLAGFAVIANLSRVMFAVGRLKEAAAALAGSWLLVIVADVVLVALVPADQVVGALALATTLGQTVVAIPLVIVTRRICGKASVHGVGHATVAGLAAAAAGTAVGVGISVALPVSHKLLDVGVAVLAAGGAVIAFGAVAYLLDNGDLRVVMARARQLAGKLRPRP